MLAIFTINQDRYSYYLQIEKLQKEKCEIWICRGFPLYAMLELEYIMRLAEESKVITKVMDNTRGDASTKYVSAGLHASYRLEDEAMFNFMLHIN